MWGWGMYLFPSVIFAGARNRPGASRAVRASVSAAVVAIALLDPIGGRAVAQGDAITDEHSVAVRHIVVTVNKSRTIKLGQPFATAVVGAPDIADVLPMTDNTIYVQGKKPGTTNISIFDQQKRLVAVADLEVAPDTTTLRNKIAAGGGSQGIAVTSANGEVVLSGQAGDSLAAARAMDLAKGLAPEAPVVNAMQVAPSQQVMLKVRILEVDRNAGRDLGVNWFVNDHAIKTTTGTGSVGQTTAPNGQSTGIGISGTFPGVAAGASPFGALLASIVNTHGISIDALLTALEARGLVKSLAEPNLIALSGQSASFLAGGQIAVPTVQPGSGSSYASVSVQYMPYGVQLKFVPTVLSNGVINLHLRPEVSEIDTSTAPVQIGGTTVPNLTDRSADTTVELRDGQSFAIGGLLQASDNEAISQVPYIGTLPVLGSLFRSVSYQKNETDLVIIVTPHLVRPASPNEHLVTPFDQTLAANDIDLFLMGNLERRKQYELYVATGGDIKGPYGYMLDGQ